MVVHTVGVGASLRSNLSYRDIQVTGIDCPDRLMLNNKAKITGSIEAIGLAGRVVKVILEEDGRQIGQAGADARRRRGRAEGRRSSSARRSRAGTPTRSACRRCPRRRSWRTTSARPWRMVVEPGIRVLYIEGTLRGRVRGAGRPLPGQGPRPGVLRPGADAAQRVPQADATWRTSS